MKKINLLLGMSCTALIGITAIGCGKSARDAAAIHLIANEQRIITDDGYGTRNYNTKKIVKYTCTDGSVIEYGKPIEIDIEPASKYVFLANTKEEGEYHSVFNNAFGYAIPRIGYGNGLGGLVPLARDYYSYTQVDPTNNPQKFHLHIDKEAFQHNIVISYDNYDSYDNLPYVYQSSYKDYVKPFFGDYKNSYYVKESKNNFDALNGTGIVYNVFLEGKGSDTPDLNKPVDYCDLYTTAGMDETNFEIKAVDAKSKETKTLKLNEDYKVDTSNRRVLQFTLNWDKVYDLTTEVPTALYDDIGVWIKTMPNKTVTVTSSVAAGSDITDIDHEYGINVNKVTEYTKYDSIFNFSNARRNYRQIVKCTQTPGSDTIVWPTVSVKYTATNGNSVTFDTKESEETKTTWRKTEAEGYIASDTDFKNETELPYKLTSDKKFVIVCVNPKGRTGHVTSENQENHDLFAIYDYYGVGSYYYENTLDYCKSVEISVSK